MAPIRADLDSGGGFELVPAGTYPATIVALKRGTVDSPTSKNKGATKINAQIKLHQGGSVFQNLTIVPDSIWVLKQLAAAAGYDAEKLSGNKDIGFEDEFDGDVPDDALILDDVIQEIINQDVMVTVSVQGERTVDGRTYPPSNQVKKVAPYTYQDDQVRGFV
jgi:hypothetical protein